MIKSQITLKQLEAFVFVVDTGTFRAAANVLGTTQPNISSRIKVLEAALGQTLLVRDAGSVQLTETGAALLQKARDVLWAGEALLEHAGRQDLIDERLRLGVTELVACSWLRDFLRLVKETSPNLRVELQVDLSAAIETQLMEGKLDLAFQTGPFRSKMKGNDPLTSEAYCWGHSQASVALRQMTETQGIDVHQIVQSNALSACVPMVCESLGVALLPERLVRAEIQAGVLSQIKANWLPPSLSFFARYAAGRTARYVENTVGLARQAIELDKAALS